MKRWVLPFVLIFSGCGYHPISRYAQQAVGERVSTEVIVSMEDPQNSVIIKDAIDRAVITKFRTALASKNDADTHLRIWVESVGFSPLRYDTNGYVITYRTHVSMRIDRTRENQTTRYATHGVYDFEIEPNAIISDQARFDAIAQGAQKGIDAFVAQVAAQGIHTK